MLSTPIHIYLIKSQRKLQVLMWSAWHTISWRCTDWSCIRLGLNLVYIASWPLLDSSTEALLRIQTMRRCYASFAFESRYFPLWWLALAELIKKQGIIRMRFNSALHSRGIHEPFMISIGICNEVTKYCIRSIVRPIQNYQMWPPTRCFIA